jgi:hypothetical protein
MGFRICQDKDLVKRLYSEFICRTVAEKRAPE